MTVKKQDVKVSGASLVKRVLSELNEAGVQLSIKGVSQADILSAINVRHIDAYEIWPVKKRQELKVSYQPVTMGSRGRVDFEPEGDNVYIRVEKGVVSGEIEIPKHYRVHAHIFQQSLPYFRSEPLPFVPRSSTR